MAIVVIYKHDFVAYLQKQSVIIVNKSSLSVDYGACLSHYRDFDTSFAKSMPIVVILLMTSPLFLSEHAKT